MAIEKLNGAKTNVSKYERIGSTVAGSALVLNGLRRKSFFGGLLALAGGFLVQRGVSGKCPVYRTLGINTANRTLPPSASVGHGEGIKIQKNITIRNKRPEQLFRFWRNFENLPQFMQHLESVRITGPLRSHWVVKAPAGTTVEWDAEIHNEIENELIAWRTVDHSEINHAGSVEFKRTPTGGTDVKVVINYDAPTGKVGALIAKLFGEEPGQQLDEDLRRFKELMEAGEIPTTEKQPVGEEVGSKA